MSPQWDDVGCWPQPVRGSRVNGSARLEVLVDGASYAVCFAHHQIVPRIRCADSLHRSALFRSPKDSYAAAMPSHAGA